MSLPSFFSASWFSTFTPPRPCMSSSTRSFRGGSRVDYSPQRRHRSSCRRWSVHSERFILFPTVLGSPSVIATHTEVAFGRLPSPEIAAAVGIRAESISAALSELTGICGSLNPLLATHSNCRQTSAADGFCSLAHRPICRRRANESLLVILPNSNEPGNA